MPELTPLDNNRQEHFLNGEDLEPITRREHFYAGRESELPAGHQEPETREEWFIQKYRGGGGDVTVVPLSVTENGTYSEEGKAYSPVQVSVPDPVLKTKNITGNGTYNASDDNADGYSSVDVNVPLPQNAYLLKSVSNLPQPIASFSDGAVAPMMGLKVAIEPQQEGSGDPSPTNVRPISGWDEAVVNVSGVNVWDEKWRIDGAQFKAKNLIPVMPNTSYYFKSPLNAYSAFKYDINGNSLGPIVMTKDAIFTTDSKTYYIWFSLSVNDYGTTYNNDISINYPSTDTDYHAYNGQTYNIQFKDGDNPLTVYGGTLDVTTGVLTIKNYEITITGTESFIYKNNNITSIYGLFVDRFPGHPFFKGDSATVMYRGICSIFKKAYYSSADQMQDHTIDSYGGGFGDTGLSGGWIRFKESSFADYTIEQAKAKLAEFYANGQPLQVVFPMVEKSIQLTPTEIKTLLGINNIWADTGDITDAEYFSKEV